MSAPLDTIWHIGLVVADIDRAIEELGNALGLRFLPPEEAAPGGHRMRFTLGGQGPPYFELIEGEPGGPWDGTTGSRLDHVAYWVDDLAAESARLEAAGCPIFVDGAALGIPANYHLSPATNLRLEQVSDSAKDRLRTRWELDDLDGGWSGEGPWQLGVIVDDIGAARAELGGALGIEWTPVQLRGNGDISVCLSLESAPCIELVQAGPQSALAWRPSPRFDHLAYWVDDLPAESARLAAVGAPLVEEIRPEIRFHHAPRSGLRLEMMSGAYRANVREGWGLENVG